MCNWKDEYAKKLVSVEEAASKVESGDVIWYGPCCSAPLQLVDAIADRYQELNNVNIVSGMALHPFKMFQSPDYIGHINYHTVFYGPFERNFYKVGNININSIGLSEVADALENVYHANVLMADVSTPDEDGYMYFGPMGACCKR